MRKNKMPIGGRNLRSDFSSGIGKFRGKIQSCWRNCGGSNAVEFALILPVFLVIFMVMVVSGLHLGIAHSLQQLSADSSRYAMVGLDKTERLSLAGRWIDRASHEYTLIKPEKLTFSTDEAGGALVVRVRYDASYMPTVPFIETALGLSPIIHRSATVMLP
jgi:Flp pilus assembly protein TadG